MFYQLSDIQSNLNVRPSLVSDHLSKTPTWIFPVKVLQLEPQANDHLLFATGTSFRGWRFCDFLLFLTACKRRPLLAWSDLYVRSMSCVT